MLTDAPPGFLAYGVLLPAMVLGLLLAAAWWRPERRLLWLAPLGVALGWALGFRASNGAWPELPPGRSTEMLFYIGVLGGVVCASEPLRGAGHAKGRPVAALTRLPSVIVASWLLLRNLVARWETSEVVWQVGGAALFLWAVWSVFEGLARKREGWLVPAVLWCVMTAGAVAFLWTGSALYAQFSGTLAALCGAAVVVSLVWPRVSLAHGTAGALGLILGCLCVGAAHFSKLPVLASVLLGLAPGVVLIAERGAERVTWRGVLLRALLVAVPLGIGLYLAHLAAPPPNPYDGF